MPVGRATARRAARGTSRRHAAALGSRRDGLRGGRSEPRRRRRRRAAGSWSAGMNQSGREAASRPETSVRSMVSLDRPARRRAVELGQPQVDDLPDRCGGTRSPSPAGDQTGANEAPSSVRRRSSRAVARIEDHDVGAERVVRVAATYRPSGEHAGLHVAGAGQRPGRLRRGVVAHDHRRARATRRGRSGRRAGACRPGRHAGSWWPRTPISGTPAR